MWIKKYVATICPTGSPFGTDDQALVPETSVAKRYLNRSFFQYPRLHQLSRCQRLTKLPVMAFATTLQRVYDDIDDESPVWPQNSLGTILAPLLLIANGTEQQSPV